MNRRDFISVVAGGAVALRPLAGTAQQSAPQIGVVAPKSAELRARMRALEAGLRALGWDNGENLNIAYRLADPSGDGYRAAAQAILALDPRLVVVQSTPATRAVLALTGTLPVVFVHVSDPIGSGFVKSFAEPGGNVTGVTDIEASLGSKWLQLLKEGAPGVTRAALLFNPETAPGRGEFFLGPFRQAGAALGIETRPAPARDVHDIEAAVAGLAGEPGGGLAVEAESFMGAHTGDVVALAAKHRIPVVLPQTSAAAKGGLIAYGIDSPDLFRRAAGYVDKLLKGATPAELPVQEPTKFQLAVNLKTAKALGLTLPPSLRARADEVIG